MIPGLPQIDLALRCIAPAPPDGVAWFLVVCFVMFGAFSLWLSRRPTFFGQRFFLLANRALMVWLFAVVMELSVAPTACKIAWSSLAWAGIALVPPAWFLFAYRYATGESGAIRRWQAALVWGTAGLTLAVIGTNPWHGLFYGPATGPLSDMAGAPVVYDHGPLFFVVASGLYVYLLAGVAIMLYAALRSSGVLRLQFVLMVLLTVVPLLANVSYIFFGFTLAGVDPTPFLFSFILLVLSLLISDSQVFQVAAIAKELVFETMPNPILVVSRDGRVAGVNRRAARLFGLDGAGPDTMAGELAGMSRVIAQLSVGNSGVERSETRIGAQHFEVQSTAILRPLGWRDPVLGWVLLFFDVTAHKSTYRALAAELSAARVRTRRILDQVRVDPLTGLLNRGSLEDDSDALLQAAERAGGTLALAMVDFDHFKSINDTFGHATGDLSLTLLAEEMRRTFRKEDRLYRFGGEEFLLICPDMAIDSLNARLETLRRNLFDAGRRRGPEGLELRFSAGIAMSPGDGRTLDDLFRVADHRLYQAKSRGRNRTVGPVELPA